MNVSPDVTVVDASLLFGGASFSIPDDSIMA